MVDDTSRFIAIAWWSGAGKSTLCRGLLEKYPDRITLIQLDWYFRDEKFVPKHAWMRNRDHPDALDRDRLYSDLLDLRDGKSIFVPVKDESKEAKSDVLEERILTEMFPKKIILVEWFLCLWRDDIRALYDKIYWLEVDEETRWKRRVHFKNNEYKNKILEPMFEKYVLPTKKYAREIIDVSKLNKEEVLETIEKDFR